MIAKTSLFHVAKTLEGLPVLGCLSGSPAARVGLRYGDVLLSVNGVKTRTLADFVEAKDLDPSAMEIVVFRDGCEQRWRLLYGERTEPDMTSMLRELAEKRILPD